MDIIRTIQKYSVFMLVALGLAATGCSDSRDGAPDPNGVVVPGKTGGGFGGDHDARAEVSLDAKVLDPQGGAPIEILTSAMNPGGTRNFVFTVRNTASQASYAPLHITKAWLEYKPKSDAEVDGDLAFTCRRVDGLACDAPDAWPTIVPAGVSGDAVSADVIVRFLRFDDDFIRNATLRLTFSGDSEVQDFKVSFVTRLGNPHIYTSPDAVVQFDFAPKGTTAKAQITISSTGDAPLSLDKLGLEGPSSFGLWTAETGDAISGNASFTFDPPRIVPVGETLVVEARYTPAIEAPEQALLTIFSNDPAWSSGKKLALLAAGAGPRLKLVPSDTVNFGGVKLGGQATRKVEVISIGSVPAEVRGLALTDDKHSEFGLDMAKLVAAVPGLPATGPSPTSPIVLPTGQKVTLELIYTPAEQSPIDPTTQQPIASSALLGVTSNAFEAVPPVLLLGSGVTSLCPEAIADVLEGQVVVPQTTLHLIGDKSHAIAGLGIAKYTWTSTQPAGAKMPFLPNASAPNPTVTVNAAGAYQFCLDVIDTAGESACAKACIDVNVVSDGGLHIELLWHTPSDLDETDASGADMDLHFAHPAAAAKKDIDCDGKPDPWFAPVFDCMWINASPNWGAFNLTADDPDLSLDDTDGAGPENLNLAAPESKKVYDVGVHYWDSHGYGTSYAEVKIYVYNDLMLDIADVPMESADLWRVARIFWDPSAVQIAAITTCFQDKAPCQGGKMWKSKGDYCITPCYSAGGFENFPGLPANCATGP